MPDRSDIIVVLGAAPAPGGKASAAMRRRMERAVELFYEGRADYIMVCGGPTTSSKPEADIMAALARDAGAPEKALVRERRSCNTFENIIYAQLIMESRGWKHPLVVTDSFHLPRALFIFRHTGMPAAGAAARGRGGEGRLRWWGHYAREAAAFARSAFLFLIGADQPAIKGARQMFRK